MKKTIFTGFSLFKIKTAENLQYRFAALSGATVSIFWALIEVAVLSVFFIYGQNAGDRVNGMTLSQGVKYIWIAQFLFGLSATGVDGELLNKIVNGDVGVELCRPLDLYWHWFAGTAAGKAGAVGLRGTFTVVCGAAIKLAGFGAGLGPPHSALHFILFLISILNAFLFGAAYGMFLTSVRMNVAWGDGPINLITVTGMVLSGGYFPLQLWPDFLQTFLRLQPFAGYLDTPARLYAGTVAADGAAPAIILQIAWTAVFIILGKTIMDRKLKRVVVQGG